MLASSTELDVQVCGDMEVDVEGRGDGLELVDGASVFFIDDAALVLATTSGALSVGARGGEELELVRRGALGRVAGAAFFFGRFARASTSERARGAPSSRVNILTVSDVTMLYNSINWIRNEPSRT